MYIDVAASEKQGAEHKKYTIQVKFRTCQIKQYIIRGRYSTLKAQE